MNEQVNLGWIIIVVGLVLVGAGAIWMFMPSIPWIGRLPGDIRMESENVRFYFPLTTCILLSAVLTLVMWLVRWFQR